VDREPGVAGAIRSLLSRKYTQTDAVKALSFDVHRGEIVGFLGPNGSGKTTTLKMLSGILYPSGGSATVCGFIPWNSQKEYKKRFSIVMGQRGQLWWDIPARESYELFGAIYEMEKKQYKESLAELTELFDAEDIIKRPVRTLSLGERMKVELIGALLHRPDIMFLDEPTIGLDIISQEKIHGFLKEVNRRHKTTILLTSHYMKDIEALCDRAIIIDKGLKVFDDSIESLRTAYKNLKVISITFTEAAILGELETFGDIHLLAPNQASIEVEANNLREVTGVILRSNSVVNYNIEEISVERIISDIFRKNGGGKLDE
jgi:ABC-2 type transport system ATP-binding protein